jgi:uncharacterized membrane protein
MASGARAWTEERVEATVAGLLRFGVTLAAVVVLGGGVIYLARHGSERPHYGVFVGEPTDLRSVAGIVKDAAAFSGRGWIQLGLLLLIATPVARVAFSAIAFAFQRDRTYVFVTLVVLALLILSLAGHTPFP